MKNNWVLLSAVVVFLFTISGLGYVTYRNQNVHYDNGSSSVLGEKLENIKVKLMIEFDGKRLSYETQELNPGSTLEDLILAYNRYGEVYIYFRDRSDQSFINRIDSYSSDENNSWVVYVDNVEYVGLFDNLTLTDGNQVRIIWE